MAFEIKTVTVFTAVDKDGDEGVMGARIGDTLFPLVCGDEARLASMFPIAEQIKMETGLDYKVFRFTNKEDVTDEIVKKYGTQKTFYGKN